MKFAYADPPYLGCGSYYKEHPDAMAWNDPKTHWNLVDRLCGEYPDGWAMSLTSSSLKTILPMCPDDCRVSAWVKPFAVFKPNVGVAYAWEPVIWRGGRKRAPGDSIRDWVAVNAKMGSLVLGQKPRTFCRWIFGMLNAKPGDEMVDMFPGSGAVTAAWREWSGEQLPLDLFAPV